MKSKTIILSSENEKGRGILTLFHENDLLQCRIRLYNISRLNRFCKIGIYHQKQVYSANMLEKNGVYTSSMVGDFDIDQDFYTAIVDTANNNDVVLSGGTYAGFYFNDNSVFNDEFANNSNYSNTFLNDDSNSYNLLYKDDNNFSAAVKNKLEVESINITENTTTDNHENQYNINKNTCQSNENNSNCENDCEKCKGCKYKEFFYSQTTTFDLKENVNSDEPKTNKQVEPIHQSNNFQQKTIVESLVPQFKYVFENYPQDEILCNLIPNSRFVKISENNEEYSIGAIYQEDEMKYICYAVRCDYNSPVPTEIGPHYQWLPLDKEDPLSEGYYMVFQDTQDLKIVDL